MRYAAGVLLSIVLGCGSLEPGDVAGGYRLVTIDAEALPYLLYSTADCDERVTGGTLALSATGGFALRYETALACAGSDAGSRKREYAGVFSFDGRRIRFNGAETTGQRIRFEGEARGVGFVVLLPGNEAEAARELELGFEPSLERQPH